MTTVPAEALNGLAFKHGMLAVKASRDPDCYTAAHAHLQIVDDCRRLEAESFGHRHPYPEEPQRLSTAAARAEFTAAIARLDDGPLRDVLRAISHAWEQAEADRPGEAESWRWGPVVAAAERAAASG